MRRALGIAILLSMIVILVSCGAGDGEPAAARKRFISIGTAPIGGTFFVFGGAIANALNRNKGDNDWDVNTEATKGSQENIRRLQLGELDLALANSAISYFAVRGEAGWDRAYPVRTVMTLAPNVALFITRAQSGLASLSDMRDRRVYVGPSGAGFEYFLRPILAAHGLTYDDFTALHGTQSQAVDLLADGAANAVFVGGAIPNPAITQASAAQDLVFLPYEEAAMEQLTGDYLFFGRATIPSGTYRGLDEEFHGLDVGSMHLITAADADEDLVYRLTRTIYENREAVVESHRAGRAINPRNVVRDTGTPFHPGAIRYYEEIGIWPAAGDTP